MGMAAYKKTKTRRRAVVISSRVPTGKKCGKPKLWAFGMDDLCWLLGMKLAALRKALFENKFDPKDLQSLISFWAYRRSKGKGLPLLAPPEDKRKFNKPPVRKS